MDYQQAWTTVFGQRSAVSLADYARQTAADMGEDFPAAVRSMRDEPGEVAREIGLSAAEVIAWCDAQSTDPAS